MGVIEQTISTMMASSSVVFLTVEVAINAYAILKFKTWTGKNL